MRRWMDGRKSFNGLAGISADRLTSALAPTPLLLLFGASCVREGCAPYVLGCVIGHMRCGLMGCSLPREALASKASLRPSHSTLCTLKAQGHSFSYAHR